MLIENVRCGTQMYRIVNTGTTNSVRIDEV